jgi:hypothetical protein
MHIEAVYKEQVETDSSFQKNDLIIGLEASLQSSNAIMEILECARQRCNRDELTSPRMQRIETICKQYERHQNEVRDHCLDIMNLGLVDLPKNVRIYTDMLMKKGQSLFCELSEAILLF